MATRSDYFFCPAISGSVASPEDLDFNILSEYLFNDPTSVPVSGVSAASTLGLKDLANGTSTYKQPDIINSVSEYKQPEIISMNMNMNVGTLSGSEDFDSVSHFNSNITTSGSLSTSSSVTTVPTNNIKNSNIMNQAGKISPGNTGTGVSDHMNATEAGLGVNLNENGGEGDMDEVGIDRRRERNRVLARKTRLRKKFFFESLQRQVAQLAKENDFLKGIVKEKLPEEKRTKLLSECNTELPAIVTQTASNASAYLEKADFNLIQIIQAAQRSFCVTDPAIPDNPIVFASQGFLDLTGYKMHEVIGRNCRFLQGPETDQKEVMRMREAVMKGEDIAINLINYKADGTKFYNQIFCAALKDADNKIVNYVGVQVEINSQDEKQRHEHDALMALPAAKKGRPRTKDREKEKKEKQLKEITKQQYQAMQNKNGTVPTIGKRQVNGSVMSTNASKVTTRNGQINQTHASKRTGEQMNIGMPNSAMTNNPFVTPATVDAGAGVGTGTARFSMQNQPTVNPYMAEEDGDPLINIEANYLGVDGSPLSKYQRFDDGAGVISMDMGPNYSTLMPPVASIFGNLDIASILDTDEGMLMSELTAGWDA